MTSQEIATRHGSDLAIDADQTFWNDKQVAALRQLGVGSANNGDLAVFFHQCQRTGLDPFARQIYMIERQGKQTIQTGIDGFRLIARRAVDRTRETLGYEDTLWCGKDGKWMDVWLSTDAPAAAKVTVIRNGERYPAIALYSEYAGLKRDGSPTQMWATKPALMLAKCAEALALRKAFPQDLSGLYTVDEMQQADNNASNVTPLPQRSRARQVEAAPAPEREPVDIDALTTQVENSESLDELRNIWKIVADLDGSVAGELRDKIMAQHVEIKNRAAIAEAEVEPSHEAAVEAVTETLDAEIVEAS
ncbi:phage recombination protein Bet [Rhodococcus ruber]|uniref:phage recombination protein Bet n=1 Tax=Rhodococcus ruber TaxID=1830 RepID=UPI001781B8F5|nr:phage recombination protein Bet [Rhodococcus ruber]MBD8056880.1 phage recombination protein Bet [Rhodococcus ruber]